MTLTLILTIFLIAFVIWMYVRILHKAGYSGWWSLLMFIPLVNLISIYVFAFSQWPRLGQKVVPDKKTLQL